MSHSEEGSSGSNISQKKYKGVRRRKWGKWVSEIRVPGSQERLWLGTYVTPEAAAIAHDIAYYSLRETSSVDNLNLPMMFPARGVRRGMSPRSVQKAASDAGLAIDAQLISGQRVNNNMETNENGLSSGDEEHIWADLDNSFCSSWGENEWGESHAMDITIDDYF